MKRKTEKLALNDNDQFLIPSTNRTQVHSVSEDDFCVEKKSVSDKSGSIKELCTWMPILNLDMIPSLKSLPKKNI